MAAKDITNFLRLTCSDSALLESASSATLAWAATDFEDTHQVIGNHAHHFLTDWEPPFKALKQLSKMHAQVHFTLWADAYVNHHWLSKSVFQAGKSEDWVVSLVDDEFESIFAEVYGMDHASWKVKPRAPFSHLLGSPALPS